MRLVGWLFTLLVGISVNGLAQNADYLPFPKAALAKNFHVQFIARLERNVAGERELPVGVTKARIKSNGEGEFELSGRDKADQSWKVTLGGACDPEASVYLADLDHNGLQDLLMVYATCGNGLAPSATLFALTFEASGRPVPFVAEGYFDADETRIADLVDLNRDGKAELIFMNFDDGYWITNLYRINNARWERIQGRFAGYQFPLFTRFTIKPNHKAVVPKPGRHPQAPDLSTSRAVKAGHLLSYKSANVAQSEDIRLDVADTAGRKMECRPVSWFGSLAFVIDRSTGREISLISAADETIQRMLNEIVAQKYAVQLYGQRRAACSPELIWASAAK